MKYYSLLLFLFLTVQASNAQDTIRYFEHQKDGVQYLFQQNNNQIEGFISSDQDFQSFTGKRINEYRVTLFDLFTNKPIDALPFELSKADKTKRTFYRFSDSAKYRLNGNESGPSGSFRLTLTTPPHLNNPNEKEIYTTVVESLTNEKKSGQLSFPELFRGLSIQFKNQYLSANQELYKQYGEECYACQWEKSYHVSPLYFDETRLALHISKYAFTGGAHGMLHHRIVNFDLETGNLVLLDSLLDEQEHNNVNKLINQKLRKQNNLEHGQTLRSAGFFEDEVKTPTNYCITNGGVHFVYNPYEIAPYAMGVITVFVSYKEIKLEN